jgi:hypothetical protein
MTCSTTSMIDASNSRARHRGAHLESKIRKHARYWQHARGTPHRDGKLTAGAGGLQVHLEPAIDHNPFSERLGRPVALAPKGESLFSPFKKLQRGSAHNIIK